MSRLPKGFSSPSIASTSQEGREGAERSTLYVTLLSSEWRSSTDRDLSTLIRELAVQLAEHPGVQVSVFLPHCSEDDKRVAASHKVHLIEAEELTGLDPVDWLINIPQDHTVDCIIGHGIHLGRQIPWIQRNHQCKWIQIVHNAPEALAMYKSNADAIPRGEKMQQTEIELCELADQVVAVGPKLADTYRRFLRSSKKHQDVIDLTPSIFSEFLDVKQDTDERKTFCVLVIGSGDSDDFNLKGYDLAAQAIAELKEKSYQLKFVCAPRGKGNEKAEKLLEHGIDRSQLTVRSFNERRETLARLFCEVDLAIMPSRSEGFGLTGLEALSAGLPVLVSGNSGLGEALMKVPNGSNCVVDSEDPKHWASKIKAVREKDRGVRLAESKLLREKYLERYRWEESLGVLVETMKNLTGFPGHGSPPSLLEYNQLPFPAGTQTPTQTYQTSHPQSFSGCQPSSVEYSRFPSALRGQTLEGPSYQTWHSPTMFWTGGYSQFPFHAATQTHGEPTYPRSHHPQSSFVQGRPHLSTEHNQLPFRACGQTSVQTSQTQSHHPQITADSEASAEDMFDVKSCRSILAKHYKRTATVPTSVWSKKSPVDIHQIYTRLSWVKEEQTPTGSSKCELKHYTDVFTANKNGVVPKRILVQGQTGIGKSTFVKKLALDWAELDNATAGDKQKDILKTFELLVVVNLKEVSKCRNLKDVISCSSIFAREEKHLTDSLLNYITNNQDKVLLVFDGYDEYRCGSNSEIYEIFSGSVLRNCCVLITTRISKADELRAFKDMHADITGFSEGDRVDFMSKMLGGKAEAVELRLHLYEQQLEDLAKVPLLLLFFCTLWKKGKSKSFPENKTKLYLAMVQYVLDYNQGKDSPARFGKVHDFKEVLSEIGKVALECLLKDDHVFEYDQLSAAVLCDESLIIGLLQVSEYAENLRPSGIVSFIHKSIQEFLAAWFICYRCVPEGNLGGPEQHTRTLKDCFVWENVFQFVCGLSNDGAKKVFQHLESFRISDPTLDLSNTIPDEENETDVPLCDVTYWHESFSNVVNHFFQEVQSKPALVRHWLDCTAGIALISPAFEFLRHIPEMTFLNEVASPKVFFRYSRVLFPPTDWEAMSMLYEVLELFDCVHAPIRITKNSAALLIGDFLRQFMAVECKECCFYWILGFNNGKAQFYITDLSLCCDDHARLFTETITIATQSCSTNLCLEQSCLKFLRSLHFFQILNAQTFKELGAVFRNCNHLKTIVFYEWGHGVCELLDEIPNPNVCVLDIGRMISSRSDSLTSVEAEKLTGILPRFNVTYLHLKLGDCCAAAINKLVSSITHKTLEELVLKRVNQTPAAALALGRSLPELSRLRCLTFTGVDGRMKEEEMELFFGGINKTYPTLEELHLGNFNARGSLAPFTKRVHFFPNLNWLQLENLNMDERDLHGLLESLRSIPSLQHLILRGNLLGSWDRVSIEQALPGVKLWY